MHMNDGADAPYWNGLAEGRLLLPRCGGCETWLWPAVSRCGACGCEDIAWIERAMAATLKQLKAQATVLDEPVLLRIGDFER